MNFLKFLLKNVQMQSILFFLMKIKYFLTTIDKSKHFFLVIFYRFRSINFWYCKFFNFFLNFFRNFYYSKKFFFSNNIHICKYCICYKDMITLKNFFHENFKYFSILDLHIYYFISRRATLLYWVGNFAISGGWIR